MQITQTFLKSKVIPSLDRSSSSSLLPLVCVRLWKDSVKELREIEKESKDTDRVELSFFSGSPNTSEQQNIYV